MRKFRFGAVGLMAMSLSAQQGSHNPTDDPTKEIRQEFYSATNNLRRAADMMPKEQYTFRPAPKMRSFGELILHIVDVQSHTCQTMLRDKKPLKALSVSPSSKAQVKATLAASFDECYEAFSELSAQNRDTVVPTRARRQSELAAPIMVLGHETRSTATWRCTSD